MTLEDEALVAMILRDELQNAGYHVRDLKDRRAPALEVAKASRPDLAFVNIRLAGRGRRSRTCRASRRWASGVADQRTDHPCPVSSDCRDRFAAQALPCR
jgi:AmiR/NasT family two-component response regulator